jgi:hypothetical protein
MNELMHYLLWNWKVKLWIPKGRRIKVYIHLDGQPSYTRQILWL